MKYLFYVSVFVSSQLKPSMRPMKCSSTVSDIVPTALAMTLESGNEAKAVIIRHKRRSEDASSCESTWFQFLINYLYLRFKVLKEPNNQNWTVTNPVLASNIIQDLINLLISKFKRNIFKHKAIMYYYINYTHINIQLVMSTCPF